MTSRALVIGGAWAIRLLRSISVGDALIPEGEVCLAEIRGRRVRIASDRLPLGWVELEAVCGRDYEVVPTGRER